MKYLLVLVLMCCVGCSNFTDDPYENVAVKVYQVESGAWAIYIKGEGTAFEIRKAPDDIKTHKEAKKWAWSYLGRSLNK